MTTEIAHTTWWVFELMSTSGYTLSVRIVGLSIQYVIDVVMKGLSLHALQYRMTFALLIGSSRC